MLTTSSNVRVRGRSGEHMLALNASQFDPDVWSGGAVQEAFGIDTG